MSTCIICLTNTVDDHESITFNDTCPRLAREWCLQCLLLTMAENASRSKFFINYVLERQNTIHGVTSFDAKTFLSNVFCPCSGNNVCQRQLSASLISLISKRLKILMRKKLETVSEMKDHILTSRARFAQLETSQDPDDRKMLQCLNPPLFQWPFGEPSLRLHKCPECHLLVQHSGRGCPYITCPFCQRLIRTDERLSQKIIDTFGSRMACVSWRRAGWTVNRLTIFSFRNRPPIG